MNSSPSHSGNLGFSDLKRKWLAILTLFIVPLSGLSIDIFVPSLPTMSHYFGVDKSLAQLVITFYMIGMGGMQFFSGAISDTFGRKKPFLWAMFVFILVTFYIPFAYSIYELLILRLFQGILAAILIVPIRSIIADLYTGREFYKMMSYTTVAWSIGPIVAPAIGGYLQHYLGWQANFYFLGSYSALSFILVLLFMPETSVHRHPFRLKPLLDRYLHILSHWGYWQALLINGILYSLVILFAAIGSFLIQRVLHYSAVEFGHMALLTGLAWFSGTMVNRILLNISPKTKVKVGLLSMLLIAVVTLFFVFTIPLNIYLIMIPIILLLLLGGIVFPNNFAGALSLFPTISGSANALLGGFIFLIPALISGLGTLLKSNSIIPLSITYVGLIAICLMILYIKHRGASKTAV